MEFLVFIDNEYPLDGDPVERERLFADESLRASQLAAEGVIARLWRRPGMRSNVGIWRAASPDLLHESIASLPCFPWLKVTAWPLAAHPNDPTPYLPEHHL